jgi:endonuclease YncB( thermonuclease family)
MPRDESCVKQELLVALLLCCPPGFAIAHPGGVDEAGCHRDSRTEERHCHAERAKHAKKKPVYDSDHPPKAGDEGAFYGPFVSITDGDTFYAKVQGVIMKFRLQGVDAPEHDQPYGAASTALLRQITRGQNLVLVFDDVDAYGRIVVQAWVGDLNVNAEMVRRGAAWFESQYPNDDEFFWIEEDARQRKVGLWALPLADRIEPWRWRKGKR